MLDCFILAITFTEQLFDYETGYPVETVVRDLQLLGRAWSNLLQAFAVFPIADAEFRLVMEFLDVKCGRGGLILCTGVASTRDILADQVGKAIQRVMEKAQACVDGQPISPDDGGQKAPDKHER
jgi:hypothetical protein